jgi:hypothetical protein
MSTFHRLKQPAVPSVEMFEIERDISGGVKLRLGAASFVMSPEEAAKAAAAILKCAGVQVTFTNPGQSIIRATS